MNDDIKRVITGKVRLSYTNLITPRAPKQGDKLKYSTTLLIPKSDIATKQRIDAAINAAIQEGIVSKWSGVRPTQPAVSIYDGDGVRSTGEYFSEECKGYWVMTASSEQKPQVVDINLNEIMNPAEIYSGMFARVSIRFFPYFNSGKKGIGCGLCNVQKLEDGEPLGGRTNAADDFGGDVGYNPLIMKTYLYTQQSTAYPQQSVDNFPKPVYNLSIPTYAQQASVNLPQQNAYMQPGYAASQQIANQQLVQQQSGFTAIPQQPVQQQPGYVVPSQHTVIHQPGYTPLQQPVQQQSGFSASPRQPAFLDPITGAQVSGGVMGL